MSNAIIITSIAYPTVAVKKISAFAKKWTIYVVGDKKTPVDWHCKGIEFLGLKNQIKLDSRFAALCPFNHYARKNIGYLKAMFDGAMVIAETDDDNAPLPNYLKDISPRVKGKSYLTKGWHNVYTQFSNKRIWPRGYPLEHLNASFSRKDSLKLNAAEDCLIQQFLADGNPDVDAIYRLTNDEKVIFSHNTVILGKGHYCPFNSQNTLWWKPVFPLLYLPSYVSFRMTDIWRSFVAQTCLYAVGGKLAFREATMFQKRNEHSLIRDFADEVPGYLNTLKIMAALESLPLSKNMSDLGDNLLLCWKKLVEIGVVPAPELPLVNSWMEDVSRISD